MLFSFLPATVFQCRGVGSVGMEGRETEERLQSEGLLVMVMNVRGGVSPSGWLGQCTCAACSLAHGSERKVSREHLDYLSTPCLIFFPHCPLSLSFPPCFLLRVGSHGAGSLWIFSELLVLEGAVGAGGTAKGTVSHLFHLQEPWWGRGAVGQSCSTFSSGS